MRDRAGEATPADQILPASGRSYTAVELGETLELVVVMETEADTTVYCACLVNFIISAKMLKRRYFRHNFTDKYSCMLWWL